MIDVISTKDLSRMPDPTGLKRVTQAFAVLDAILMGDDEESRSFGFNGSWAEGEAVASMRNGSGDEWFAFWSPGSIVFIGLFHEAPDFVEDQPAPHVYRDLPEALNEAVFEEPAFDASNKTFCLWRCANDAAWNSGVAGLEAAPEDGSRELLSIFVDSAAQYVAHAAENYEMAIDVADVERVLRHEALTPELARRLNPKVDLSGLLEDLETIGYPIS